MQKKVITLAVAAALVVPAVAMADVKIYGKADIAFGTTSNGVVSTTQVASQVTKIGLNGSEDLGDGLNAIWQIEQQVDIDDSTRAGAKNTLATRNSFVGLKSDNMGTVLMGRHDTPYKLATRKLDVFADQIADSRHLMGGGTGLNRGGYMDMRPGDALMYQSPNLSGFEFAALYSAGAETATLATNIKGSLWSLSGSYKQGAFYGAIAHQKVAYGTAGTGTFAPAGLLAANDSLKASKAGVGYAVTDALKLNMVYEKITSSIGGGGLNTLGRSNWHLGGEYSMGNDAIKLAYTRAGDTNSVANTGAKMIGVGYDHNLSKRTALYAQYNKLSNDSAASYGFGSSATTATVAGVLGQNISGFMVGMKHAF